MPVLSGKNGRVNGQNTVRSWDISYSSDNPDYKASNTRGGTGRLAGNRDWDGSFDQYGHTPTVMPGETFTFTGYTGIDTASGLAMVDSVDITADIEASTPIEISVSFSSAGDLTLEAGSVTDTTIPDPPSAAFANADWAGSPIGDGDVHSWSLTISADNPDYASANTNRFRRRVSGNIDWEASVDVYEAEISALPAQSDQQILRLFVNATDFWELKWGIVQSVEPSVDIEGSDMVDASCSFAMNGFKDGAIGYIRAPGAGSDWWPSA